MQRMGRTVAIGKQNFEDVIVNNCFYVDKTYFIRDWWERNDDVTVITRPRRFGKTLTLNMLDCFFSLEHRDKGSIFEGLSIWTDEKYRQLQGTYPVISLTFADVKEDQFEQAAVRICENISEVYGRYEELAASAKLSPIQKEKYERYATQIHPSECAQSIRFLSGLLNKHYGKKVLIFLDEYDTPMQEAYIGGSWDQMAGFMRKFFNSTFKTNPYMQRAVMTGITRVGKESMFSDFNNPAFSSVTSSLYADVFGFTEQEVFSALDEMGYGKEDREAVREWYDGFTIGNKTDLYNPWSIINFLSYGELDSYWVDTSSNSLISHLFQKGSKERKLQLERLLQTNEIETTLNKHIHFRRLEQEDATVWSLLLASGYVKAVSMQHIKENGMLGYEAKLAITNKETKLMFATMVHEWFDEARSDYNDFTKALLRGDVEEMQAYFERVTQSVFSSFDCGTDVSQAALERFFHGFVLGLIVDLKNRYDIKSNRESGLGRYDVMLIPQDVHMGDGIIIEFKVQNGRKEKSLEETADAALRQIEDKCYARELLDHGLPQERIHKYAFAFRGKEVLIRG